MIVTARSKVQAQLIIQIIAEFLAQRGLRLHPDKTAIVNIHDGFDYLGRHYQRKDGVLLVKPAGSSVKQVEQELESIITNFTGTQRDLIKTINWKLAGWGHYHRTEDAYMEFRHIDAVVEGLLVNKMCAKYPQWHRQTVLNKFWIKDGLNHIFVLPTDHTVRIHPLAQTPITLHKPCKLKFNPYLDKDYQVYLKHRRDVQKSNGQYRAIWTRQSGRCAYCGERMLADQEVELVEKHIGEGWKIQNLLYIHRQCSNNVFYGGNEFLGEHIDLFSILEGLMDNAPAEESPYIELTEFFRQSKQQTITLHFREIECILGDNLPWEAYCFDAFWYDDTTEMTSLMWQDENFPFHVFRFSESGYNITYSWSSQGYKIKSLHRERSRVVFRKAEKNTSGIVLPKAMVEQQLPDEIVYKFNKMVRQFMKDNGL